MIAFILGLVIGYTSKSLGKAALAGGIIYAVVAVLSLLASSVAGILFSAIPGWAFLAGSLALGVIIIPLLFIWGLIEGVIGGFLGKLAYKLVN
jgi:Na+/proline symporter